MIENSDFNDLVLGVAANALTALFAHAGRKGKEILGQKEKLKAALKADTSLESLLRRTITGFAKGELDAKSDESERLRVFLHSPDAEAFVRQVFSWQLTQSAPTRIEALRTEFVLSLSLFLGKQQAEDVSTGKALFDTLLAVCENALTAAIDLGLLSAHEAKSVVRHRLILDELSSIQKNLAFLKKPRHAGLTTIHEFEEKYRQQVGNRHGYIVPPHFDAARKIPIEDLYVCSDFAIVSKRKSEQSREINFEQFESAVYRAVVLGNPGSGKSTLTSKLCSDLSQNYDKRLLAGRQVTPILVILRDYGAEKDAQKCSILQFIERTANSKYQVASPEGAFEYLLLNGRAFVSFDGLDELLDTRDRQEISADIESFCNLYPSVPVLVTSREVGYEQAPLDGRKFEVFRISEFDDNQVGGYAKKWFAADQDLTAEQQRQKVSAFLEESQTVPDLRSNPLMLALMCNIYRGENYIPRNRAEVYEKCAVMLFERWDKGRGILVPLPFEAHINPAMKFLAHWIYSDPRLQAGVTEKNLIGKAADYLCTWRFEDREEARRAAQEFIDFCRGRAWVFTDTGSTKQGDSLYQFTHRTFLEYFTAAHLIRTRATPDSLGAILLPKIAKREWDVVAQLAFQLKNKDVEGAGDKLLKLVLRKASRSRNGKVWNLLSFAARSLEFMVPTPKTTRDIANACLTQFFSRAKGQKDWQEEPEEAVYALLRTAFENRSVVASVLIETLQKFVQSQSEQQCLFGLEFVLNLSLLQFSARRSAKSFRPEEWDFWITVEQAVFEAAGPKVEKLASQTCGLAYDCWQRGKIPITKFIQWHGFEALFRQRSYSVFPRRMNWSVAESLVYRYASGPVPELGTSADSLKTSAEIGKFVLHATQPLFREVISAQRQDSWFFEDRRFVHPRLTTKKREFDSDVFFGLFCLMGCWLEQVEARTTLVKMLDRLARSEWWYILESLDLDTPVNIRLKADIPDKLQPWLDAHKLQPEQQEFVCRWVRKELNLVDRKGHGRIGLTA